MANKNKQAPSLDERAFYLKVHRWQQGCDVAKTVAKCLTVLGVVWQGKLSITELAGKQTDAQFLVSIFTNFLSEDRTVRELMGIAIVALAILNWYQRKLNRLTIARLSPDLKKFELTFDPARTSSKLGPFGDSREEDRK